MGRVMRVVFMGTPAFAVPTLKALLGSEFPVIGIVTQPDRPRGRGRTVSSSPVKEIALAHNLPILQPEKMKQPEFLKALGQWSPDVIVVAAFGRILPKSILDLPPRGCINVHASLLPQYRGAAPIQWAVMNGDLQTGITTMLMDEGMDTGAILLQEPMAIGPDDTAGEVSIRLAEVGGQLLIKTLRGWQSRQITPFAQDGTEASLAPLLKKEDGRIDWSQSATEIANRIRGLSPWPGAFTFCQKDRLTIWKGIPRFAESEQGSPHESPGTISEVGKNEMIIATGQGRLVITELQPDNRKRMSVGQFLSGYRLSPGIKLTTEPVTS